MKNKLSLLAVALAVLALAVALFRPASVMPAGAVAAAKESVFDRVMRTNTLRCGYDVYEPYFTKDAATGRMGGIYYDFAEAVAQRLGIKIDWSAEVGLGDIGAALEVGKIDAFCSGLWTAGKRVRNVDFLRATAYEPILPIVRADDHRFDADASGLNFPEIRGSVIDGEGGGLAAQEKFPRMTLVSLSQLSGLSDMFQQVATKKADVTFAAPAGVAEYLKNNPGVLRPLVNHPVHFFPCSAFAISYGQPDLRDALNVAQEDVILNGTMEKILKNYEAFPNALLRVAPPYVQPVSGEMTKP